ncbi:VWA domain-containing protein [bacterium CPR1]|nr:VWA domain-containing protein [bacterium CPR1]
MLLAPVAAETQHILMLDVSGSMRDRGYATREGWGPTVLELVQKLFQPGSEKFAASDSLTIVPFSDAATDAREGRAALPSVPLSALDPALLPLPGGGATDMNRCLDLALEQNRSDVVLTWILTDNENNLAGNRSDREFYERLAGDPAFTHVYFFPLARTDQQGEALVMYLLVRAEPDSAWVDELASEVKRKTGYEGVLFRPLYSDPGRSVLDFGKELQVQTPFGEHQVEEEGGTTVLNFEEGDELAGQLKFRVRSHLKGWKIVDATMEDAEVELTIPDSYPEAGEQKFSKKVTPQKLTVDAGQESADFFLIDLQARETPLKLERPLLSDMFASSLQDIEGRVKLRATIELSREGVEEGDLRPSLSPEMTERVAHVPNLAAIEELMVYQGGDQQDNQRSISFQRKLIVRTRANPLGAIMVGLLGLGGLAVALLVGWAAFGLRSAYRLEGPGEDEELSLPYLAGSYLICSPNGLELARLRQRFGSLSVVPEPEVEVNGRPEATSVRWEGPEARLEICPEGKEALYYTLVRAQKSGSGGGGERDDVSI